MLQLKKLLIALDLSSHDDEMMAYLEGFSKAVLPDEITMLHVSPHSQLPDASFGSTEDKKKYLEANDAKVRESLEKLKSKHFGHRSDVEININVVHGNPLKELLEFADNYTPDLVMIGKKQNSGGSGVVSQKLARRLETSILFVTDRAQYPIKKILIPTDYSDHSKHALTTAVKLHPLLNDPVLYCMHVYEVPPGLAIQIGRTPEQFDKIIEENATEAMEEFLSKDDWKHVEIEPVIQKNRTNKARQIADFAEENHIGLIIIGARGHSMLESLFIGSTTEKLLQLETNIPMWIIR